MTFAIEAGIPVPTISRPKTGEPKYPFSAMKVGDSFAADTTGVEPKKIEARLRHAALRYTKQNQGTVQFTIRKMPGCVRCWRVA